jgi:hypothetical protein
MNSEPHTPPSERFDWFEQLDELLKEESVILEGLKQAVENNWLSQEEADDNLYAYITHRFEKPM